LAHAKWAAVLQPAAATVHTNGVGAGIHSSKITQEVVLCSLNPFDGDRFVAYHFGVMLSEHVVDILLAPMSRSGFVFIAKRAKAAVILIAGRRWLTNFASGKLKWGAKTSLCGTAGCLSNVV
jgi:hypothetical protein